MHEFNIRVFRAIDDQDSCEKYIKGHTKVLEDYGVKMITSNKPTWMKDPNVYCVIAESINDNMIAGGVKIHISDDGSPLPLEEALGELDNGIYKLVDSYSDQGVGELCGLWNDKLFARMGLGVTLTRAGISIINQLSFQILMGICADFTMKIFNQVGFRLHQSHDIVGEYPYPTDEYITRVLGIMNAETLDTATPYDKEIMLSLRNNLTQTRTETGKKGDFTVNYSLKLLASDKTKVSENSLSN